MSLFRRDSETPKRTGMGDDHTVSGNRKRTVSHSYTDPDMPRSPGDEVEEWLKVNS
jgi:hypothetical protein